MVAAQPPRNQRYHGMALRIAPNNGQNQAGAGAAAAGANGQAVPGLQDAQLNGQAGRAGQAPAAPRAAMRYINLGPIRLGFAQGQNVGELANQMGVDLNDGNVVPILAQGNAPAAVNPADLSDMDAVRNRLQEVDQRIQQEVRDIQQGIQNVQTAQQELHLTNLLLAELARVRQVHNPPQQQQQPPAPTTTNGQPAATAGFAPPPPPPHIPPMFHPVYNPMGPFAAPPQIPFYASPPPPPTRMDSPNITRHGAAANTTSIPAGSPDLPEGVVIPPGWSLLPLQRLDQAAPAHPPPPPASVPTGTRPRNALQEYQEQLMRLSTREPDSNHVSTDREQQQQQQPELVAAAVAAPQVEVAAPTPLTPNWGGSAQLFGGGNVQNGSSSSLPLGLQAGGAGGGGGGGSASSRSASQTREASSNSNGEQQQQTPADGEAAATAESSTSKGKAPAATVEDAADEEGS